MSFLGPNAATNAMVAATVSSVTLFNAGSGISGRSIYNGSTAVCFLTFGTVSSSTAYTTQVAAGASFTLPLPTYSGPVTGIWTATNGSAATTQW